MTHEPTTAPEPLTTPAPPGAPGAAPAPVRKGMSRRATLFVLLIAVAFVLMPFFFWRASWFGAPMSPAQLTEAFAPGAEPRKTQHALAQLSAMMDRRDPAARQWYPGIVAAGKHSDPQIRLTAAWVMGRDNSAPEFHPALSAMLADSDAMVRANAALALVRFGDAAGRPVLLGLLQPFTVIAPSGFAGGTLRPRLKPSDAVRPGTMVARIDSPQGVVEVRSPVPGVLQRWLVSASAPVAPGQPLCVLSPDAQAAWEALRGLYLIGQPEDAAVVESFLRTSASLPPNLTEQARLTLQALQSRN